MMHKCNRSHKIVLNTLELVIIFQFIIIYAAIFTHDDSIFNYDKYPNHCYHIQHNRVYYYSVILEYIIIWCDI